VLSAAGEIPEVRAVATIGAPAEPSHVRRLFTGSLEAIEREGSAEVDLAGRRFRISRQLVEDLDEHALARRVRALDRALLVLHAPLDRVVGIDNARAIFEAALHPKSFVALDDADHLLSRREDSEYAAAVLATWAARYVGGGGPQGGQDAAAETLEALEALEPGEVRVEEVGRSLRQRIRSGTHAWWADEPERLGGSDSGPDPYAHLLAGLGACTSMTLRMYAARKQWPLEGVGVRLRHTRIHAEDCERCETTEGRVDRIERDLELRGPLSREQRGRLLEIADRCPVHRTLSGEIDIVTRAAEGS
jgi:putative redox protein